MIFRVACILTHYKQDDKNLSNVQCASSVQTATMFLLILASILIGILGLWYYKFFHYYGYLKKIPAPTVWPVLGNAIEFHDNDAFLINLERNFRQLNTKTLRIHLPTQTVIMTKEYKLIEYILGSQQLINKGFEYDFFLNWLGLSVFTSSGMQQHKINVFLIKKTKNVIF